MNRLLKLLVRRFRARRLGTRFPRAAGFVVPDSILVAGTRKDIHLPDDNGSKVAFIDIFLDDCYGLERMPDKVNVVLDVGAHAGLFSVAVRNRWPGAQVHAYEPNPFMAGWISSQAAAARFSWWPEAVGAETGHVVIRPYSDSVQTRTETDVTGGIPQVAFREALARAGGRADLVKLDCEGAEWGILSDARAWEQVGLLTMEYHLWAGYTLQELEARIKGLGFTITYSEKTGADFGLLRARRD
jgi:FkbM family methyltransferase